MSVRLRKACVIAAGVATERAETAQLLVSEVVTNSVLHQSMAEGSVDVVVDLFVGLERDQLRVEVTYNSPTAPPAKQWTRDGGYGLAFITALADRWGTGRDRNTNQTWFELDLPRPGE